MSPLELVDDRFEKLAEELRAARPAAPDALRERVHSLAPPPPPRFELSLRRVVPAAGLAGVAAALGVAVVLGVVHGSAGNHRAKIASRGAPSPAEQNATKRLVQTAGARRIRHRLSTENRLAGPPRFPGRPAACSGTTPSCVCGSTARKSSRPNAAGAPFDAQARRLRRLCELLGPGEAGTSTLALRIPIERVQTAIARFSGYGTLVSQRIVLKDLQRTWTRSAVRIRKLRAEDRPPRQEGLSQAQLDRARALLRTLTSRSRQPSSAPSSRRSPSHGRGAKKARSPRRRGASTGRSTMPARCSCASSRSCSTRCSSRDRCCSSAAPSYRRTHARRRADRRLLERA